MCIKVSAALQMMTRLHFYTSTMSVMSNMTCLYEDLIYQKFCFILQFKLRLCNFWLKFNILVNILPLFTQAGYIRIDGSVPSSERIQLVHKFQSDPETRVAILSIQAAGQVHAHIC